MSRSYKKFPCLKMYFSDGKKTSNRKFRNVSKDILRHQDYDKLPMSNRKLFNRVEVYEYRDIFKNIMSNNNDYFPEVKCNKYLFFGLIAPDDRYFYINEIQWTKFDIYKTFMMK